MPYPSGYEKLEPKHALCLLPQYYQRMKEEQQLKQPASAGSESLDTKTYGTPDQQQQQQQQQQQVNACWLSQQELFADVSSSNSHRKGTHPNRDPELMHQAIAKKEKALSVLEQVRTKLHSAQSDRQSRSASQTGQPLVATPASGATEAHMKLQQVLASLVLA